MAMGTQWNHIPLGMAGAMRSGLRYEVMPTIAQAMGLEWPLPPRAFVDIRTMEAEALTAWSKKRGS